jgi:hypothetical protein
LAGNHSYVNSEKSQSKAVCWCAWLTGG